MPKRPNIVRWTAGKLADLLELERELFNASEIPLKVRARLALDRYLCVASNSREINYLGSPFHYDGRLMPMLLPAYLAEINRIDLIAPLATATIVDIGANVGQFGATISRRFPGARVWSFEPNQSITELLQRNAAASPQWQVVPWGVGEEDAEVSLWAVDGKSAQGSILRDNATAGLRSADAAEHRVVLRRLTTHLRVELGIPELVDVLKIDVEGAEDAVLPGLAALRWRYLMIETSLARAGGLTVQGARDLVASIWGEEPTVIWQSVPALGALTIDAILALPSNRTD